MNTNLKKIKIKGFQHAQLGKSTNEFVMRKNLPKVKEDSDTLTFNF